MKLAKILSSVGLILFVSMLFASISGLSPLAVAAPLVGVCIASHLGFIQGPVGALMLNFGAITTAEFPDLDGVEAMGGYTSIAYLAFNSEIETFPGQPDIETVTDVKELAKLTGNFTMLADKYFYKVRVKPNSTQFTPEGQGEAGGRSFKAKGSFFIPGVNDASMGLARMLNNKYGVIILPDPDGKTRICIGTDNLPCVFSATGDGGKAPADPKGFTYNFEADSFAPGWVYEGFIPLSATERVAPIS